MSIVNGYWANAAVYCEDELHEAFYERLFHRLFPGRNDFYVKCLSGKGDVLKLARKRTVLDIAQIFVIDKDYDDLVGELSINASVPGVVYLRRHSIENYLASFDAIIQVALEEQVKEKMTLIQYRPLISDKETFAFELLQQLESLCRYFAVARKNQIPFKSSKVSSSEVYAGADLKFPLPSDAWISSYISSFKETCGGYHEWILEEVQLAQSLADAYVAKDKPWANLSPADHVVGKLLLAGLLRYIDGRLGSRLLDMPDNQLFTRIAAHLDITPLSYLKDEIVRIAPDLG